MKILIIHNRYLHQGGEDEVVKAEKRMLEQFGHEVILYERSNEIIKNYSCWQKLQFAVKGAYHSEVSYQEICELIKNEKPDVAHFHNTFYAISPSAYDACYDNGVPIVQSLHNYRGLCPIGIFYREESICEECLGGSLFPAIKHKCWKNSYCATLLLVRVLKNMTKKKIFSEKVKQFIVLSEFSRQKFLENDFGKGKISIKPCFLDFDPGVAEYKGEYGLFIGALRPYKGVQTLVKAWQALKKDFPLKIIGDGPLFDKIKDADKRIELLGQKSLAETLEIMKKAAFLIVPSECYETFSRVTMEAFACGIPAIVSNRGAMKELIEPGETGLLFEPGNSRALADKIQYLISERDLAKEMGQKARNKFEQKFTLERNYEILMEIYNKGL